MLVEAIATGKTVAEATQVAAAELGVPVSAVQVEVLEEPKRSLLGKIKGEAKVRVTSPLGKPSNASPFTVCVSLPSVLRAASVTESELF